MRLLLHTSATGWEVGKSSISNIFPSIGIILDAFQPLSNSCLGPMLKKPTCHLENLKQYLTPETGLGTDCFS